MASPFSAPRFSLVQLENTDLKMCLLSCPGIRFSPKTPLSTSAFLDEDLDRLQSQNVEMVVSCLYDAELLLGAQTYADAFKKRGIDWHRIAIPDMTPPSRANDKALSSVFQTAKTQFAAGKPVAFHCMAGLGRTGTVAARLAMTYGLDAEAAIKFIRSHHAPEAIETEEQEAYLKSFDLAASK